MTQESPVPFDAIKVGKEITAEKSDLAQSGRLAAFNSIIDSVQQNTFAKVKEDVNSNIDWKKLGLEGFHIDDQPVREIPDPEHVNIKIAMAFTDSSGKQHVWLTPSGDEFQLRTDVPPKEPPSSPSSDREKVNKFFQQQVDTAARSLPVGNGEGYFQVLERMEAQGTIPAVDDAVLAKRAVFLRDSVNKKQVLNHGDTFDTMTADEKIQAVQAQLTDFDKMSDTDKAKIIALAQAAFPDASSTQTGSDSTTRGAGITGSAGATDAAETPKPPETHETNVTNDGSNIRDAHNRVTTNNSGFTYAYDDEGDLNLVTTHDSSGAKVNFAAKDANGWHNDDKPPKKFQIDPALDQKTGDLSFQYPGSCATLFKANGVIIAKNDDGTVAEMVDELGNDRRYAYNEGKLIQVDYFVVGSPPTSPKDPENSWTLKGDHFENGENPPKSKSVIVDATTGEYTVSDILQR